MSPADLNTGQKQGRGLAGTGTLTRFMLRRDRIRIPAWALGLAVFAMYVVVALEEIIGAADVAGTTALFHQPVGRLLTGPGYGFEDPSIAQFFGNGYGLYFLILVALMSILLVVRHTRVEEQSGRAELVRANVVGRHATLTATVIISLITNLVAAAVVFAIMVGVGEFEVPGSLLFAATMVSVGMVFTGVTAITVQLSEYSRGASAMAGAVLGIAFVLRAVGDMAEAGGGTMSWLSPLGWAQQTAPFVLDRWWPLALLLGLAVVTTAAGYLLSSRRDLGASVFQVRPGAAEGSRFLGTPVGLAFRLQRAGIIGWAVALAITGLVFGGYSDALISAADDLPEALADFFDGDAMLAGYLDFIVLFIALLVSTFAILAVQSLRSEETSGRAEPVLATPVSRTAWMGSSLAVTAVGALVLMLVAGLATGVGAAAVTGESGLVGEQLLAYLNQVPTVLTVLGIAALLMGVLPRAIPLTWILVAYGLFASSFAPMLDVPQAAINLSPFEHPAAYPIEDIAAGPIAALLVIALATVAAGLLGFRRRDLHTK